MESSSQVYNVYFDAGINAVVMQWDGYSTAEQFREGSELMLNTLLKHEATQVLANIKDMVLIGRDEQEWLMNTFIPRAVKFGFTRIALVRPSFYFNNVAVESISGKLENSLPVMKFFEDVDDAKNWLMNEKNLNN